MSTETTNKKIKIDNGTIFGKTYTDKAVDELLKNARDGAIFEITSEQASKLFDKFDITDEQYQFIINNKSVSCLLKIQGTSAEFPVAFTRMIQDNEIAAFFSLGTYYALSCTSSDVNPATNKHMLRFQVNIMDFHASLSIYENEQNYDIYGTPYITYFDTIKGANILHEHNTDPKDWQFTEDKTIPLFGKHSILVPKDSADANILPCTPSDNGKVLSVVNGEAQWASAVGFNLAYYSHFITINSRTSSTSNTSVFFCTYQNNSNDPLNTLDSLKTALTGKRLLCTGHTDTGIAEYISGGVETITVGVVDKSGNSVSDITIDSSFNINDQVSPVE